MDIQNLTRLRIRCFRCQGHHCMLFLSFHFLGWRVHRENVMKRKNSFPRGRHLVPMSLYFPRVGTCSIAPSPGNTACWIHVGPIGSFHTNGGFARHLASAQVVVLRCSLSRRSSGQKRSKRNSAQRLTNIHHSAQTPYCETQILPKTNWSPFCP